MFSYAKRANQPVRYCTDYLSDESTDAPRVSVVVDGFVHAPPRFIFQPFVFNGWWNIYFADSPSDSEIKSALARLNHTRPEEIILR